MSRDPFVWQVQVRREVLDDEIARLHELPYSVWRDVRSKAITKTVKGRDERLYRLIVTAEFVGDTEDIRVTVSLSKTGLLRRGIIRQDFVITPDNEFRV
jgi:hypothetical protein